MFKLFPDFRKKGNNYNAFKTGLDLIYQNDDPDLIEYENIGSLTVTNDKRSGSVLAPNGSIYGIPFNSWNKVIKITPTQKTDTDIVDDASITSPTSGPYYRRGGCLAPNGKIYCAPYRSTTILVIDPATDTTYEIADATHITASNDKRYGLVQGADGRLYGIPEASDKVLIIDPTDDSISSMTAAVPGGTTAQKWSGGVLAQNGKIYCSPYSSTQVLEIDTENDAMTLVGPSYTGITYQWRGIINGPDGALYCVPFNTPNILKISGFDNFGVANFELIPFIGLTATSDYFNGAAVLPSGLVVFVAHENDAHLILDVFKKKVSLSTTVYATGTDQWDDGTLAPNGKIYCTPDTADNVAVIGEFKSIPKDMCLSKYYNNS